jgi:hypothetical protein
MYSVRFNYLYRDGANFKAWGEVIFPNPRNLSLKYIETKLFKAFLPDNQFIAHQIRLPEIFIFKTGQFTVNDHCFHEFASVENCQETSTDFYHRSISDFLLEIERISKQGWKAFDILNRA